MSFEPQWAHVALSPVWLVLATLAACTGVGAFGKALLRSRLPTWVRAFLWIILFSVAFGAPTLLARLALPIMIPEMSKYPRVSICFGEPHWNMLIAALAPPMVGLVVLIRSWRGRLHRHSPEQPAGA